MDDCTTSESDKQQRTAEKDEQGSAVSWQTDPQGSSAAATYPGGARKKRRRQRPQRTKGQRPPQARLPQGDGVSREHILQDLEGLLRQIREEAEESANGRFPPEQISEMARSVSAFSKGLEEQSDPISERARGEYQRLRERLVHALRDER